MIELLLEAERALTHGLVDQAERLYRQVVDNDPHSSIAVMGLARVALERGDDRTAYGLARQALAIDAENPAAQHLVMRLTEVMAGRGEVPPDVPEAASGAAAEAATEPPAAEPPAAEPLPRPATGSRKGVLGRLFGRKSRS
jgi:thioredoxin-like negative regulator of GroEL